jgi:glycosyltransferase involved in cell wall biosynthesis
MQALHFAVPGDLDTLTGGYLYDRRVVDELRAAGWDVTVHTLDASFPHPGAAAREDARRVLAKVPDGAALVADGLALGTLPELAEHVSQRLRLTALVHHPLADETGLDAASVARLRVSERRALAAAARVIVTSAATARALAANYAVPPSRIAVVEPGTDPAPLARGSGSGAVSLLCVASLTPRKGHAVLLDALAAMGARRWRLVCAGSKERDPGTAAALAAQIGRLALADRVELAGELAPSALAALYDRADAFVLASFHEGYGMALAEALARGLPVVSTAAGAIPDTVRADAGLLVPPGDVAALAAALRRLLDDADLRARLAAGARAARERLPTWTAATARFASALP